MRLGIITPGQIISDEYKFPPLNTDNFYYIISPRMRFIKKIMKIFRILALVLCLQSCSSKPQEFINTDYHVERVAIDVQKIDLVNRYTPSFYYPYVDHLLHQSTHDMVDNWVYKKFINSNKSNKYLFRITIEDAPAIEDTTKDNKDYIYKLSLHLNFELFLLSKPYQPIAEAKMQIFSNGTISKKEQNQDVFLQKLSNQLTEKLESESNNILHKYFKEIIIS